MNPFALYLNRIPSPWCTKRCRTRADASVRWDEVEKKDFITCIECGACGHHTVEVPPVAGGGDAAPTDPDTVASGPEDGTPADTRTES